MYYVAQQFIQSEEKITDTNACVYIYITYLTRRILLYEAFYIYHSTTYTDFQNWTWISLSSGVVHWLKCLRSIINSRMYQSFKFQPKKVSKSEKLTNIKDGVFDSYDN